MDTVFTITPTYYYPVERALHEAGVDIGTQVQFTKVHLGDPRFVVEITALPEVAEAVKQALGQFKGGAT